LNRSTHPHGYSHCQNKYQVVIPRPYGRELGISRGDVLEAKVERGRLTYTPKNAIDRIPAAKRSEHAFPSSSEKKPRLAQGNLGGLSVEVLISSLCGRSTRRFPQFAASAKIPNNPTDESGRIGHQHHCFGAPRSRRNSGRRFNCSPCRDRSFYTSPRP